MATYRRVYDSRHLQGDCQEPESAPEPYARQLSMGIFALKQYSACNTYIRNGTVLGLVLYCLH